MDQIAIFRLPTNYNLRLTITGKNQTNSLYFSVAIHDGKIVIGNIDTVNWQELIDFLKKNEFQKYEAYKINPKYFDLLDRLRKELSGEKVSKVNSQRRILILLKRLFVHKEALDLTELAKEFKVSHSQLVRDIAIIRSEFEDIEIRYNRKEHKYQIK